MIVLLLAADGLKLLLIADEGKRQALETAEAAFITAEREVERFIAKTVQIQSTLVDAVLHSPDLRPALLSESHQAAQDALHQLRSRIQADWVIMAASAGVLASSGAETAIAPLAPLKNLARTSTSSAPHPPYATFFNADGKAFMVTVHPLPGQPVEGAGLLLLGHKVDQTFLNRLSDRLPASVSAKGIAITPAGQPPRLFPPSQANRAAKDSLSRAMASDGLDAPAINRFIDTGGQRIAAHTLPVGSAVPDTRVDLLVWYAPGEILALTSTLNLTLIGLFAGTLAVGAVGAVLISRNLSRPLHRLMAAIGSAKSGEYPAVNRRHKADEFGALAASFDEMMEQVRQREERLSYLSEHDLNSGLPNREYFERLIDRHSRGGKTVTVVTVEIGSLRQLHHALGRNFADELVVGAALHLTRIAGGQDYVARVSDATLAVLFRDGGPFQHKSDLDRVQALLGQSLPVGAHVVDLNGIMGIASNADGRASRESLLQHAEAAMFRAIQSQIDAAEYDPDMDNPRTDLLSMMSEMRRGLASGQFHLFLQPKIDVRFHRIVEAEALVRWFHPEKGLIPPDEFIPLAEQTGHICALTDWVLGEAVRKLQALRAANWGLSLAINLSVKDVIDPALPDRVDRHLKNAGLTPADLSLEITESGVMKDPDTTRAVLTKLRRRGHRIAVDDFGSGQASLAYLKRLPVTELKIDKAFVHEIASNTEDASIVHTTIDLGHHLNLSVTAEGVEDAYSLTLLHHQQCDLAQGFHISKPLDDAAFLDFLESWRPGAVKASERHTPSPVSAIPEDNRSV